MGRHKVEYWEINCDWEKGKCSARVQENTRRKAEEAWASGGGVVLPDPVHPSLYRYYCPTDNPENN